jgi:sulfur carrier protein
MQVFVNGEARDVPQGATLSDLVHAMGLGDRRLAIEVNLEIVPRSSHGTHRLREGDRVEIVQAIGGG